MGMPGTRVDGGEFWAGAISAGAVAAVVSTSAAEKTASTIAAQKACVIPVADMTQACAQIAAAFYDYPTSKLKMVGVTGTNGKTTTTHLIEFLLGQAKQPTALLGTLYTRWAGYQQTAVHTTPFAPELQQQLAEAVAAGGHAGAAGVELATVVGAAVVVLAALAEAVAAGRAAGLRTVELVGARTADIGRWARVAAGDRENEHDSRERSEKRSDGVTHGGCSFLAGDIRAARRGRRAAHGRVRTPWID